MIHLLAVTAVMTLVSSKASGDVYINPSATDREVTLPTPLNHHASEKVVAYKTGEKTENVIPSKLLSLEPR